MAMQALGVRHHGRTQGIDLPACASAMDTQAAPLIAFRQRCTAALTADMRSIVITQLFKQGTHTVRQTQPMLSSGRLQVLLSSNTQGRNGNLIVKTTDGIGTVFRCGFGWQALFHRLHGHADGVIRIISQQTLIKPLLRAQHRLATQ